MNLNKVMLAGRLTRDPELKYTPSNKAVAQIGIATNHHYKTADGEKKEEVVFVDCEAWGLTAENISKYFSKGKPIFIEGRLKLDQWQDKDGGNRSKLKVVVDSFQFVESAKKDSDPAPRATATAGAAPLGEDDIPFSPGLPVCCI